MGAREDQLPGAFFCSLNRDEIPEHMQATPRMQEPELSEGTRNLYLGLSDVELKRAGRVCRKDPRRHAFSAHLG